MIINKYKKLAVIACLSTTMVAFSGCQLGGVFAENKSSEQTEENGKEKKESCAESKTEGYDVSYAGVISGYADKVTIYSVDGKVVRQGAATFEWLSDTVVKVVYDNEDEKTTTSYIVDQDKVVVEITQENEEETIKDANDESSEANE